MIGLILAAGPTCCCDTIGFPPNSKPKSLFHHIKNDSNLTLLERQVRLLRKNGIKRIRIVTGYRSQDIEQFNREKNLGLELVYNPKWETDGVNSLIVGVQDLDDDLLIVYGDSCIGEIDLNNILKCDMPLVSLGLFHNMYKFGKQHLDILKRADKLRRVPSAGLLAKSEQWHQNSTVKCPYDNTQGLRLGRTVRKIYEIAEIKGEAVHIKDRGSIDVDYFRQTAEALGRYSCNL